MESDTYIIVAAELLFLFILFYTTELRHNKKKMRIKAKINNIVK